MSASSSKRGLMRPSHSNRVPIFVVVVILLLASMFIYNLYSSSTTRTELQGVIDSFRDKTRICFSDKLELEEKLETVTNTCTRKYLKLEETVKSLYSANKALKDEMESVKSQSNKLSDDLSQTAHALEESRLSVEQFKAQVDQLKADKLNAEEQYKRAIDLNQRLQLNQSRLNEQLMQVKGKYAGFAGSEKQNSVNTEKTVFGSSAKSVVSAFGKLSEHKNTTETNDTEPNNRVDWPVSGKLMLEQAALERDNNASAGRSGLTTTVSPRFFVQRQFTTSQNELENRFLEAAIRMSENNSSSNGALDSLSGPRVQERHRSSVGNIIPPYRPSTLDTLAGFSKHEQLLTKLTEGQSEKGDNIIVDSTQDNINSVDLLQQKSGALLNLDEKKNVIEEEEQYDIEKGDKKDW